MSALVVDVVNRSRCPLDEAAVAALAAHVLAAEGAAGEVAVHFVGERRMRGLNREHLREDRVTDVLSFPLEDEHEAAGARRERRASDDVVPRLLGDVVVCPHRARDQATRAAVPLAFELALLIVHGLLHLLGHDHEVDAGQMALRQAELLADADWEALVEPR